MSEPPFGIGDEKLENSQPRSMEAGSSVPQILRNQRKPQWILVVLAIYLVACE